MAHPQFAIVISRDGAEVLRRHLPPGEYVIGRETGADVVVEADQVSPRHARLTIDDDAIFVEDLGSDAGTFINALPVKDNTRVWPAQKIRIGAATVEALRVKPAGSEVGAPTGDGATGSEFVATEMVVEHTYEIEKVLTREEEGLILDTHDSAIRRDLAMRVMAPGGSEQDVLRFVEEAQITGRLEHPNIPPIHELGTDEKGRPYYTMKLVRGVTLAKVLELLRAGQAEARAKYSLLVLLAVLERACDAVAFAHSKAVIHGDLKPESISIGDFGEVLVTDWGQARVLVGTAAVAAESAPAVPDGLPHYFAPELARGGTALDARTDVYALGAILYHILALRPPLNEDDRETALKLVAEGKTDRLDVGQRYPHLPRERVPDPLAAIVAKAMALQPSARYAQVEAFQADLAAYRNATITAAEQVGPIRQFFFVVRRYKMVSLAAAIVVGTSLFFGTAAVLDGQRARRNEARANSFVASLKSKAPELLKLAENEADAQQFDRALENIATSLAIDPAQPRALRERAWALLGLERWSEAAAALRAAQQADPAGADFARLLPAVEKMKTIAADPQRWRNDSTREIFRQLQAAGATGPAFAFAEKMQAGAEVRRKLVDQRLAAAIGRDGYRVTVGPDALLTVSVAGQPLRTLDAVRGLPIDILDASGTPILDLQALRAMRLQGLIVANTKIGSIDPLARTALRTLVLDHTPMRELGLLKDAPLEVLSLEGTKVYDLSFTKGMPLRVLNVKDSGVAHIGALAGLPLESLNLAGTSITDLTPVQNAPLKELNVRDCRKLNDFNPILKLTRLERLSCNVLPPELAPLRESKTLQTIEADAYAGEGYSGARPAAEFWAEYDAKKGAPPR